MDDLVRRAIRLLAAWNCELARLGTREPTRAPVKQWLDDAVALMEGQTNG